MAITSGLLHGRRFVFNIGGEGQRTAKGSAGVGAGGVRPLPQYGFGGITPEIFWKFYMPNGAFWGIFVL